MRDAERSDCKIRQNRPRFERTAVVAWLKQQLAHEASVSSFCSFVW